MKNRVITPFATLAVLACGGGGGEGRPDDAEGPRTVFRDSAGIRIVENTGPPEGSRLDWRIGPEPLVSIGQREGEAPYLLERVFGARMLSDGRIVVGDEGPKELRVFDPQGIHLETWGGRGEGPGEFGGGQLWGMARLPGDSIVVWEYFFPEVTVFGPNGEFVRRFMPEGSRFDEDRWRSRHFWVRRVSRDGWILGGQDVWYNDPLEYAIWDADGTFRGSLGTHPGHEAIRHGGEDPSDMDQVSFYRSALWAIWGDQVLIGTNHRYEMRAFALDGSLARIVRLDRAPRAPTGDHIEAMIEDELSWIPADETRRRAERRRELRDQTVAEHLPAFDYYRIDALDHLWVFEYEAPGEERPGWLATIFDPEGRVLGYFEVPEGMWLSEIGEDYVLGQVRDEFGVPTVHLWPFER